MSKRNEYIAAMKSQLDELDTKMSELQAKAKEVAADAQDKYKEEMANLRYQSTLGGHKLDELRKAGDDTWEAMVGEMEKVRDAIGQSFKYFKAQL